MSCSYSISAPTHPVSKSDRILGGARLFGLCSVSGGADEPCETTAIAIDRLSVKCDAAAAVSDKVVFSFSEFGIVEATIVMAFPGGFEAGFDASEDSKLAIYLDCMDDTSSAADKMPSRIVPIKKLVTLAAAGEPESMARIIDLSKADVSLTTSKDLTVDQPVKIGLRQGHVARVFDGGATVAFNDPIPAHEFDPLIELRSSATCTG